MNCARPHVVVTGASSGIGRASAIRLADAGWHVYAGVRRPYDGESLRRVSVTGGEITPLPIDVTAPEQVEAAVGNVTAHVGEAGLGGLVDNAGIGVAWPVELVPLNALRWQFEVNVIGQVAVLQAFLPLLRQATGRIVVIGSVGDRFTPPFGGPLAASKAAIASLADALRQELAPWGIRVVLLEPASIHTEAADKLERDAGNAVNEFPDSGEKLYRDSYLGMINTALARERRGSSPTVVANLVAKVLTTQRPAAHYLVGKDARVLAALARYVPTPILDTLRRRVFGLPEPGSRTTPSVMRGATQ